jgi:hypothetical protein
MKLKRNPWIRAYSDWKIRFYRIWFGIKSRCLSPTHPAYERYHGREITICKEWLDFKNFFDDMHQEYLKHLEEFGEKNTQIDRIDNNRGYFKENCHWVTPKENANNKQINLKNKTIKDIDGQNISIFNFCLKYNIKYHTFQNFKHKKYSLKDILKRSENPSICQNVFDNQDFFFKNKNILLNPKIVREQWAEKVIYRYGIGSNNIIKTLQETGDHFGYTRERIRQIENNAKSKILSSIIS